jgi:hypothetical protein
LSDSCTGSFFFSEQTVKFKKGQGKKRIGPKSNQVCLPNRSNTQTQIRKGKSGRTVCTLPAEHQKLRNMLLRILAGLARERDVGGE